MATCSNIFAWKIPWTDLRSSCPPGDLDGPVLPRGLSSALWISVGGLCVQADWVLAESWLLPGLALAWEVKELSPKYTFGQKGQKKGLSLPPDRRGPRKALELSAC